MKRKPNWQAIMPGVMLGCIIIILIVAQVSYFKYDTDFYSIAKFWIYPAIVYVAYVLLGWAFGR